MTTTATPPREADGPGGPGPDAAVAAAVARGNRSELERFRAHLLDRIHHRSDDFDAIANLRVVERTLANLPRDADVYAWQELIRPGSSARRRRTV